MVTPQIQYTLFFSNKNTKIVAKAPTGHKPNYKGHYNAFIYVFSRLKEFVPKYVLHKIFQLFKVDWSMEFVFGG